MIFALCTWQEEHILLRSLLAAWLFGSLFDRQDECSTVLRNASKFLPDYTLADPRVQYCS
jgi:hypothetical protein